MTERPVAVGDGQMAERRATGFVRARRRSDITRLAIERRR